MADDTLGSAGWPSTGINISVGGQNYPQYYPQYYPQNYSQNYPYQQQLQFSSTTSAYTSTNLKTDVKYVIVKKDGTTLELDEQDQITPREMINLCKFLTIVAGHATSCGVLCPKWSELIKSLSVERHFKPGSDLARYDSSGHVLFIYLVDGD